MILLHFSTIAQPALFNVIELKLFLLIHIPLALTNKLLEWINLVT
ncbi:hypothetical protein CPS_0337 [Colwellia psychrerythraea 34H]|uniref:Uncharacterized protein n=1 Tax=Colwellia psychrerythraea (strain 34H / ATCC BAA-681) TaxID=167879 RepID=Q48A11_COLP3|nr:hypothetical protein CPS_0337 [Colwellia psychrerythraea 34H]